MTPPLLTLHPLNVLIADVEFALTLLSYSSLRKLIDSLNELLVITRDFIATERLAQIPTAYSSLEDHVPVPPYEADIVRFMNRCRGVKKALDLIEYTLKQSRNSPKGRPLVEALETMLGVLTQFWEFYEDERWRHRRMRIASLRRLDGLVVKLIGLIKSELSKPNNMAAERATELERSKVELVEVVLKEIEGDTTPEEDTAAFWFGD
ncbi:hypothetical protein AOQ84DRAFT_366801 [Glonium stellatum]|uniref:Uncharacterized protein n=1 Tax=Glonium stellatum TaxID=574774 RepID=A0A8E2EV79_9PEZI|nr:hypothetical protein AOQ84DRAFT_366801 [Glonium stellatum]